VRGAPLIVRDMNKILSAYLRSERREHGLNLCDAFPDHNGLTKWVHSTPYSGGGGGGAQCEQPKSVNLCIQSYQAQYIIRTREKWFRKRLKQKYEHMSTCGSQNPGISQF
jgi:hypothetical protein